MSIASKQPMRRPTLVRNSIQGSALWAMSDEEEEEPAIPPPDPEPRPCRFCGKQVYSVEEVQTRRQKDNFNDEKPFLCSLDCAKALDRTPKGKGPPATFTARNHGGPYGHGKAKKGEKGKHGKSNPAVLRPKGKGFGPAMDEHDAREQTHRHHIEMAKTIVDAVFAHFPKQ